jgi:NADH dehydrogenase/putative oxidoreductase
MLILSLVIQFNYVAVDVNLFWAVLFGWYLVRGAGALSFDRLLSRGIADTALPFAETGLRAGRWMTRRVAPAYLLGLRLWLAGAVVLASFVSGDDVPGRLVPVGSAAELAGSVGTTAALFLFLGLGARFAALAVILAASAVEMMGAGVDIYMYWLAALLLIVLHGPGVLSLDAAIESRLRYIFPQLDGKPAFSLDGLPRVVIVGAGFGGLACAAALRKSPVQVTLVDRQNYHLFQPLLYQVATAGLAPGDIATPIRGLFRDHFNTRILLGWVTGVDAEHQEVQIGEKRVPYDFLVLATGARHNYFGRDEWEPDAPGLKRIEDATEVRRRLLTAFEQAENTDDPEERRALLTFVIVGAGPTGVELAGAIAELARYGMEKEFRNFDPADARVVLVQSGPRVLPSFPQRLSELAGRSLEALGVEILTDSRVEHVDDSGVRIKDRSIPAYTVLWAAGVVASPAGRWVNGEADRAGRVRVQADLTVPGMSNVFAIGDTALSTAWNGQPVPGLAPAAKQGGLYVAKVIHARAMGKRAPRPFVYRHLGSLATIGRKSAVIDFGFMRLSGAFAWWLWGLVHVYFLVGLRNRLSVMFDWFWAYLTYRSGTRLITGGTTPSTGGISDPKPEELQHA